MTRKVKTVKTPAGVVAYAPGQLYVFFPYQSDITRDGFIPAKKNGKTGLWERNDDEGIPEYKYIRKGEPVLFLGLQKGDMPLLSEDSYWSSEMNVVFLIEECPCWVRKRYFDENFIRAEKPLP